MNDVVRVLRALNIEDYTIVGNKLIIEDDIEIYDNLVNTKLSSVPFNLYFRGKVYGKYLPNNVYPLTNLDIANTELLVVEKDINLSRTIKLTGISKCFLNNNVSANRVILDNCVIYKSVNSKEQISLSKCIIKYNDINCKKQIELRKCISEVDLDIKDCDSVFTLLVSDNKVINFSNVKRLEIRTFDINLNSCNSILTIKNVDRVTFPSFNHLRLLKGQSVVDNLIITKDSELAIDSPFPLKPYIVCNRITTYNIENSAYSFSYGGVEYKDTYPNIKNIEKFVILKDAKGVL